MQKIIKITSKFEKAIARLDKKWIYNESIFIENILEFFANEENPKFRKHKININNTDTIRSISIGYDLRTLYYRVIKLPNDNVEYIFFDIWNHNDIY